MFYAKTTYGGKLVSEHGGTSPDATIVFSPMIQKVIGEVDTKEVIGKAE